MPATATAGPPMRAGDRPMPDPRVALYPGTFDPINNGPLDSIRRAVRLVDHLIIAVARNAGKNPLLGVDERLELVRAEIGDLRLPAGGRRGRGPPRRTLP